MLTIFGDSSILDVWQSSECVTFTDWITEYTYKRLCVLYVIYVVGKLSRIILGDLCESRVYELMIHCPDDTVFKFDVSIVPA